MVWLPAGRESAYYGAILMPSVSVWKWKLEWPWECQSHSRWQMVDSPLRSTDDTTLWRRNRRERTGSCTEDQQRHDPSQFSYQM